MEYYGHKVAIVTGGGSGIGRAVCLELGRRGAAVVVADVKDAAARETVEAVLSSGGDAAAHVLDVSEEPRVARLVDQTVERRGRLDFMFNNAGISAGANANDMTIEDWQRIVEVNLMGVIYGTHHAYRIMLPQRSGHIVNTSSLMGLVPTPGSVAYSATKHAIVGLSTSLREEAADLGVRVTVVCPGRVRTEISAAATRQGRGREAIDRQRRLRGISAEEAALRILRGVERNRAVVVFPSFSRRIAWTYRYAPFLLRRMMRKRARALRTAGPVN